MPLSWFYCFALVKDLPSPSAIMMKRKGDRGSPCLIPLDGLKGCKGPPFSRIEKKALETSSIIQFVHS